MKVVLFSFIFMSFIGCASVPSGDKVISSLVESDKSRLSRALKNDVDVSMGRSLFIKTFAYPQILEDGDLLKGAQILLNVGRENVDLNQILGEKHER